MFWKEERAKEIKIGIFLTSREFIDGLETHFSGNLGNIFYETWVKWIMQNVGPFKPSDTCADTYSKRRFRVMTSFESLSPQKN